MKKATSLQSSFSHNREANLIKLLDPCKPLPLNTAQGFTTLQSVTQARKPWFFNALKPVFFIGRGGAVLCNSGLSVKAARRSLAVVNTPIPFTGNHFYKTKGAFSHA